MKRFIFSASFAVLIVILYQFIDLNLFAIDFPRRVNSELFKKFKSEPEGETEIVLLDIEDTQLDSLNKHIELLIAYKPKVIGVNLCDIESKSKLLEAYPIQNKDIIICDCSINSNRGTSRIANSKNEVTHFKSDNDSYFELQLVGSNNVLKERGTRKERINFRKTNGYYRVPLNAIGFMHPDFFNDKTVLIGSQRPRLITPMNNLYGRPGEKFGDMSDLQVSANIISTISRGEFIHEISWVYRYLIIVSVCLACAGLMRLLVSKNFFNIIAGLVILVVINGVSSYLIVYTFSKNYYMELNEMTMATITSAIISFYWNFRERKGTGSLPNVPTSAG